MSYEVSAGRRDTATEQAVGLVERIATELRTQYQATETTEPPMEILELLARLDQVERGR